MTVLLPTVPFPTAVKYVVTLALYPSSNTSFGIEVQRSVGSTSNFGQVALLSPETGVGALRYTDVLPHTTARYYYRARHVKPGYTDGAFTRVVSSTVGRQLQFDFGQPQLQLTGASLKVPIQTHSSAGLVVGSLNNSSYVTKVIRVPFTYFGPNTSTQAWTFRLAGTTGQYLHPTNAGGAGIAMSAPLPIPKGVTITNVAFRMYRASTADTAVGTFTQPSETGAALSPTFTHSTVGWQTVQSTQNSTVGSNQFLLSVALLGATSNRHARLGYVDVTYRMPNYAYGY